MCSVHQSWPCATHNLSWSLMKILCILYLEYVYVSGQSDEQSYLFIRLKLIGGHQLAPVHGIPANAVASFSHIYMQDMDMTAVLGYTVVITPCIG